MQTKQKICVHAIKSQTDLLFFPHLTGLCSMHLYFPLGLARGNCLKESFFGQIELIIQIECIGLNINSQSTSALLSAEEQYHFL